MSKEDLCPDLEMTLELLLIVLQRHSLYCHGTQLGLVTITSFSELGIRKLYTVMGHLPRLKRASCTVRQVLRIEIRIS